MAPLTPEPALVFIGFMGAGKSKAVQAASSIGLEAVDADALVERELGMPMDRFFAERGEEDFRAREAEATVALLDRAAGGAIALGGGAVLSKAVREALRRHVVVWLEVDPEAAWERVGGSDRPLARDRDSFERLLAERAPVYERLADAIVVGERAVVERALPFLAALTDLPQGTRMAWAKSASGDYPAYVGRGLLDAEPLGRAARYGDIGLTPRAFCVTDTTVRSLYRRQADAFEATIEVDPGEQAKTLAEAERVLRELAAAGWW